MAKRFTDCKKWDKPWYKKLRPEYKCLWDYILSKCDMAGIWEVDFDGASYHIGTEIDERSARVYFKEHIKILTDRKWFVIDFVKFQYGEKPLNPKSPIHKKVLDILEKYSLLDSLHTTLPTRVKEEEEEKEEDEEGEKEEGKEKGAMGQKFDLIFPWGSEEFLKAWNVWVSYRAEAKKPYHTGSNQQMALQQLTELARGDEKTAIGIIKNVMAKNGLNFFIDGKQQSTNSQNAHAPSVAATALDHFSKLRGKNNGGGDQVGFDEHRDAG